VQELESAEDACRCPCCCGAWVELFEAEDPDLITTRGGVRVVTEAAIAETIRRLEAEIASLEKAVADSPRDRTDERRDWAMSAGRDRRLR